MRPATVVLQVGIELGQAVPALGILVHKDGACRVATCPLAREHDGGGDKAEGVLGMETHQERARASDLPALRAPLLLFLVWGESERERVGRLDSAAEGLALERQPSAVSRYTSSAREAAAVGGGHLHPMASAAGCCSKLAAG